MRCGAGRRRLGWRKWSRQLSALSPLRRTYGARHRAAGSPRRGWVQLDPIRAQTWGEGRDPRQDLDQRQQPQAEREARQRLQAVALVDRPPPSGPASASAIARSGSPRPWGGRTQQPGRAPELERGGAAGRDQAASRSAGAAGGAAPAGSGTGGARSRHGWGRCGWGRTSSECGECGKAWGKGGPPPDCSGAPAVCWSMLLPNVRACDLHPGCSRL